MIEKEFIELLKIFEDDLKVATQKILIKKGVERDSDLVKSIEYQYKNDMFKLMANDYYEYVSTGRRRNVRKVPVEALIQWIKDKSIPYRGSINSAAFRIQQAIYKNGIKGKKFENPVVEVSTDMISEYSAEELSQLFVDDLVEILEQNN